MKKAFIALVIIFLINASSFYYDWYLRFFWFDMTLHFLGGFFVAMFMAHYLEDYLGESKLKNLLIVIGATMLVGVVWEFAEYIASVALIGPLYNYFEIHFYFMGDLDDTVNDLAMDILGAIIFSSLHLLGRGKAHQVETNS